MVKNNCVIICLLIVSTFYAQKKSNHLIIDLKQEVNDSINLEFSSMSTQLWTLSQKSILMKRIKELYIGIPQNDSVSYFNNFEDGVQGTFDLHKMKLNDSEKFLSWIKERNIDTLKLSKTPLKQGVVSIVGFYKNKQFLIADANRNKDFSDDIKYEFNINFREKPLDSLDIIAKLPATNYYYESYVNGKLETYHRQFILYPNKLEPYSLDKKEIEYSSKFRYRDYWKGEVTINNKVFEFYYQSRDNERGALFIKPKEIAFSKVDDGFNNQFRYKTNETFAIDNGLFIVDSINRPITKVYLQKISEYDGRFGNSIGKYLKNYILKDLEGKTFESNKIINTKQYTLIDFWATWCGPCIGLTPKLIKAQDDFYSKLNIIGLSVDKNTDVVKEYIKKHNISWLNGFLENKNFDNALLQELNIQGYPTLILVDQTGKIMARGSTDSFDDIIKLIK